MVNGDPTSQILQIIIIKRMNIAFLSIYQKDFSSRWNRGRHGEADIKRLVHTSGTTKLHSDDQESVVTYQQFENSVALLTMCCRVFLTISQTLLLNSTQTFNQ